MFVPLCFELGEGSSFLSLPFGKRKKGRERREKEIGRVRAGNGTHEELGIVFLIAGIPSRLREREVERERKKVERERG